MNSVNVIGRLTADPELRNAGDTQVCKMRVAVNTGKDEAAFIDVEAWGRSGENCAEYLSKGMQVGITGSIKQDNWNDKDGNKRSKLKVSAFRVDFLGRTGDGSAAPAPAQQQMVQPVQTSIDSDSIPF